jgi:hypothetical protein
LADFVFFDLLVPADASCVALPVSEALPDDVLSDLVFFDLLVVAVEEDEAVPESVVD